MKTNFYGNDIVEIIDDNILIKKTDDVFWLFSIYKCSTIIIKKENILNDFFILSTGIAGEILQKFSNYHKRMGIIGDFTNIKSKPLNDFVYKSNKTKQKIFVKILEEALKIFNE